MSDAESAQAALKTAIDAIGHLSDTQKGELLPRLMAWVAFGGLDARKQIRTFQSANIVMTQHRESMARLQSVDLSADDSGLAAVRWYMRAAQIGPVPDAVVSLWIALEALTRPANATKSWDDVKGVEDALRRAVLGLIPSKTFSPPSAGCTASEPTSFIRE